MSERRICTWCSTSAQPHPWLVTLRAARAVEDRGIVPALPPGWLPVTWDELIAVDPRQVEPGCGGHGRVSELLVARGERVGCQGEDEAARCGCSYCARCDDARRTEQRVERAARVAAGQCQACRKREPAAERVQCGPCLDKLAARARRTRAARRSRFGEVCVERPRLPRRDLCAECCLAA